MRTMAHRTPKILGLLMAALLVCLPAAQAVEETDAAPPETGGGAPLEVSQAEGLLAEYGFKQVYENAHGALYTDTSGSYMGTFAVKSHTGGVWFSNSPAFEQDAIAFDKAAMKSLLTVTYYSEESQMLESVSSSAGSVDAGGLQVNSIQKGMRFTFAFPDKGLTIPLDITLEDDGSLVAEIPMDQVKEEGSARIFSITMLPWFCAAGPQEEGFILVPDGSGAVMELNNGKGNFASVDIPLYGGDASEVPDRLSQIAEKGLMPIYGIQKEEGGVFAIVESGAPQSSVTASVSGSGSEQNVVSNSFDVRQVTTYSLEQGGATATKTFNVYQESKPTIQALRNRYLFLAKGAGLAEMAAAYRDYLTGGGAEETEEVTKPAVYIETAGAVKRKKSVLGFPADVTMELTSFEEAQSLLAELKGAGVETLNLRFLSWNQKNIDKKMADKASPASCLGGKKGLNSLLAYTQQEGIGFYPDTDLLTFSKAYPFAAYFDAVRNFNNQISKYYEYKLNHFSKDTDRGFWYMLSLDKLAKTSSKFLDSYKKLGIPGLSLSRIGNTVLSDTIGKELIECWEGAERYASIVEAAAGQNQLMLESPILPLGMAASQIVGLPGGSGYDMCDYAVPFYQMTVSGLIAYTGESINFAPDTRDAFLTALETGSGLQYSLLAHSESARTKGTAYDTWIGADASSWTDTIVQQYQELCDVREKVGGRLVDYEVLDNGVVKSTFEGGVLFINKSNEAKTAEGREIPAKGYVTAEGAQA